MKKFLAVLLAVVMTVTLLPFVFLGASASERTVLPALTEDQNGRTYYYYESFETDGTLQGAENVMERLELSIPEDTSLQEAHIQNLLTTEGGEDLVYMYELRDGKLYIRNRGIQNEVLVFGAADVSDVMTTKYAVEYTLTYLPTSTNRDGYFSILYAFDATTGQYGHAPIRISGYGNNEIFNGSAIVNVDKGDTSYQYDRDWVSSCAYMVNNHINPTLYERLFGDLTVWPQGSNNYDLRGSAILAGTEIHVKMVFDGTHGPAVYVNGIQVSAPVDTETAYSGLTASDHLALAFQVTPGIDCILDDVMVYGGVLSGEEEAEETQSSLYMTEITLAPAVAGACYIEIYNNGTQAVDLAEYGLAFAKKTYGSCSVDTKYTNYLRFDDYIGTTLTFGMTATSTTLDNPETFVLQPGETGILFFVTAAANSAENPHLATTQGDVSMAKFRQTYDLSDTAKILGIPTVSAIDSKTGGTVQAATATLGLVNTSTYHFALVSAKDETGNEIIWNAVGVTDATKAPYIQSRVDYVPVISQGYVQTVGDSSYVESTATYADGTHVPIYYFGGGGAVVAGYSAHYLYAANAAEDYNTGILISRAYQTIAEEKNVGDLLDVQNSYFQKLQARRDAGYDATGGLVITEFVPRTGNLAGEGTLDAFEAFEITNASALVVNVYDYGLVSSGQSLYGDITNWTKASLFEKVPTTGVQGEDAALARYTNPDELSLAPGASAVVWNFREDSVTAGAVDGSGEDASVKYYTVEDFRNYHGIDDSVPVIVVASFASVQGVVAENEATVSYGIATAEKIREYRAGTTPKVTEVISDVTVPLSAMYFSPEIKKVDFLETMAENPVIGSYMIHYGYGVATAAAVEEGTSLAGYYQRTDTGVVGIGTVKSTIYMYTPCVSTDVAEAGGEYYTLAENASKSAYGSFLDVMLPVGYSVSLAYNGLRTDAVTSGAVMGALNVNDYTYVAMRVSAAGKNEIGYLLQNTSAFITIGTSNTAVSEMNTLGKIVSGQFSLNQNCTATWKDAAGNVTSTVEFNLSSCRGMYTILPDTCEHWLVNGEPYNAGDKVMLTGDTEILPITGAINAYSVSLRLAESEADSGLRFTTAVSKELYNDLVATYGAENVHTKTAIAPAAYFAQAGANTVEALDALGYSTNYLVTEATGFYAETASEFIFAGSLVNVQDRDMEFAAIGYLEVTTAEGVVRYYGTTTSQNCALSRMAATELADVAGVESAVYCYSVEDALYSAYSEKQRALLAALC